MNNLPISPLFENKPKKFDFVHQTILRREACMETKGLHTRLRV